MTRPLRRTRGDLIATAAITAISVAAVAGVWATAPIRGSELTPAAEEYVSPEPLASIPEELTQIWSHSNDILPGVHLPVIANGVTATVDGHNVVAINPAGETLWTYERDRDICSLATAWGEVIITYKANSGCGDVVSIDARTGQYDNTRSAIAPDEVVALASNDRVGTVGTERLELWRSDLVRTVEYGEVEGKQEPDLQPTPECDLTSAMTRSELLAVTETCPDEGGSWLRFQDATPEESRSPEITQNIALESTGARLIAVAEEAAAVYLPGEQPELVTFDAEGQETFRRAIPSTSLLDGTIAPFTSVTADLPHHMTWFDGERLYLLAPSSLSVTGVVETAIGTGVALDGRLLVPISDGLAAVNWSTGEIEKTIPVDRDGFNGMVTLGVAGGTIVEKRGDDLVGLAQLR